MINIHHIVLAVVLLASTGVTIVGSLLAAREYRYCYEHVGVGGWVAGIATFLVFSCIAGFLCLWKHYPRLYSACVSVNTLLVLALAVALIFFWGRQATTTYSRVDLANWHDVAECFAHRDLCDNHYVGGCCDRPRCDGDDDCNSGYRENDFRCYFCTTCRSAVFDIMSVYSRLLSPAFIGFFVVLLVFVSVQIVMDRHQIVLLCGAGGLSTEEASAPHGGEADMEPQPQPRGGGEVVMGWPSSSEPSQIAVGGPVPSAPPLDYLDY